MSDKEVQSNSVTYKRKDYLNFLADAENALAALSEARQKQIAEWKSDTSARQADFWRLMKQKFFYRHRDGYRYYLDELERPVAMAWLYRLLGREVPVRVDEYGSAEAYVAAVYSFDDFVTKEWERYKVFGTPTSEEILTAVRALMERGWEYFKNEWESSLHEVQKSMRDVENSIHDATFTIPREKFDEYAGAMSYDVSKLPPVVEAELRHSIRY